MPTAALVISPPYTNNEIFNLNSPHNRDNALHYYWSTREAFRARGWDMVTHDLLPPQKADAVFYTAMPGILPAGAQIAKSYIWLGEPPTVIPANFDLSKHQHFAKVFTWNDALIASNPKHYLKLDYGQKFWPQVPTQLAEKTGFCCVISGNKRVSHPLELYSQRIRAIRWFESHASQGFDLYGIGWDSRPFTGPLRPLNRLNRSALFKKLMAPRYPSWRGPVKSKFEVMRRYRFALCFENGRDIPGYITEKIFDCMQAGCIPVYWGAPNITNFVPANCFIDLRDFMDTPHTPNYVKLNAHLRTMDDKTAQGYINRIAAYIRTEAINGPWSSEHFARTIADVIAGPLPANARTKPARKPSKRAAG